MHDCAFMDADADPLDVVEISEPTLVAARHLRTSTARKVRVALLNKGNFERRVEPASGSSCSTNEIDVACPQRVVFFPKASPMLGFSFSC